MDNELLYKCEPLIMAISNQFYGIEKEDLLQAGRIGLINAYNHYNKNSNTKFSTFAYQWIYGEMYNLTLNSKMIKQNRELVKLIKLVKKAKSYLTQIINREPTIKDIANYLELDENIIANAYSYTKSVLSLDQQNDDEQELYNKAIIEEDNDTKIDLEYGINNLLNIEKQIIKYRYYDDLTQEQTAKKLGLSQVKVSRYEQKSLKKLKKYLINE